MQNALKSVNVIITAVLRKIAATGMQPITAKAKRLIVLLSKSGMFSSLFS